MSRHTKRQQQWGFSVLRVQIPMAVSELRMIHSTWEDTGYYVCPNCKTTLDREFAAFCDRCGQRLDWRRCEKARIIYPDSR